MEPNMQAINDSHDHRNLHIRLKSLSHKALLNDIVSAQYK